MTDTLSSNEVFFSIDIETDGPVPLTNSILSIAVVAFDGSGTELGQWEANLHPLRGAVRDPVTMKEFWEKNPDAWAYCNQNKELAEEVMPKLTNWVNVTGGRKQKVAVCFPSGYDFTWVYTYLMTFCGESPFSFSSIDMKTYASALLKRPYRDCGKKNWPHHWFDKNLPHTHKAIEDAREQGLSFLKMRAENLQGREAVNRVSSNFWNSQSTGVK